MKTGKTFEEFVLTEDASIWKRYWVDVQAAKVVEAEVEHSRTVAENPAAFGVQSSPSVKVMADLAAQAKETGEARGELKKIQAQLRQAEKSLQDEVLKGGRWVRVLVMSSGKEVNVDAASVKAVRDALRILDDKQVIEAAAIQELYYEAGGDAREIKGAVAVIRFIDLGTIAAPSRLAAFRESSRRAKMRLHEHFERSSPDQEAGQEASPEA